jgi:MFS family permease
VLNVALTSALTKASAREDVGGTLGLATALQSLTGIVAPLLGGLLLQEVGAWSLGVFGAVVLAWLAVFAARRVRPVPQPATRDPAVAGVAGP